MLEENIGEYSTFVTLEWVMSFQEILKTGSREEKCNNSRLHCLKFQTSDEKRHHK